MQTKVRKTLVGKDCAPIRFNVPLGISKRFLHRTSFREREQTSPFPLGQILQCPLLRLVFDICKTRISRLYDASLEGT